MRGYLLLPMCLLLLWYPVVYFAGARSSDEMAVRTVVRAALSCLGNGDPEVAHFFSTRVRRVDGVLPPRFDRRQVAEYAALKEAELGQLPVDIYPAAVRLSGAFADVDLHYVLQTPDGKETIYRGKVVLNKEGDTWKIVKLDFR